LLLHVMPGQGIKTSTKEAVITTSSSQRIKSRQKNNNPERPEIIPFLALV